MIVTTRGHNLSFAVSPLLHRSLHFLIPKRVYSNSLSLATALLLNSGMSHFRTQWIYLKTHSQRVLQTCNRHSSDYGRLCSRTSALVRPLDREQRLGRLSQVKNHPQILQYLVNVLILVVFQNTLTSGCISSPVLYMGSKAEMLSDYTDTKSVQSARTRVLISPLDS